MENNINNKWSLTQIQGVSTVGNEELCIYNPYIVYLTLELSVELFKFLNNPLFQNVLLPVIISLLV